MRILFISNFFPPARPGGYTQWCHEVAEALGARGYEISVLTSRHQADLAPADDRVRRQLHLEGDLLRYRPLHFFTQRWRKQRENRRFLEAALEEERPDLVFIWGMWAMSRWIARWAEELLPGRVVYYISDYWPSSTDFHRSYWSRPARRRLMRIPKRILNTIASFMLEREGTPDLEFDHAICVSEAVKRILVQEGLPFEDAVVIHGGSDLDRFLSARSQASENGKMSLLYAGQLVPHKGVHTAIEAVARLVRSYAVTNFKLTVVGSGPPHYEKELHELVRRSDMDGFVHFNGPADKEDMPRIFAAHDILVFPSIYQEPLARVTQEAMASGMAVVGTTTGGTGEILEERKTGLTFAAGDAGQLAEQLHRLSAAPALRRKLGDAARQAVKKHFTLERMVADIEAYLKTVFAS